MAFTTRASRPGARENVAVIVALPVGAIALPGTARVSSSSVSRPRAPSSTSKPEIASAAPAGTSTCKRRHGASSGTPLEEAVRFWWRGMRKPAHLAMSRRRFGDDDSAGSNELARDVRRLRLTSLQDRADAAHRHEEGEEHEGLDERHAEDEGHEDLARRRRVARDAFERR